ncbi:hypothetical protein F442_13280 [Phytophthora nicotianae P10297]|uniref:Uncharacterized protein n=4 Tax=Phytophthora nicotianae TaxID=4792 RepID=V9ETG8_PHYNI|nr:hypothetical protein F443_13414 [Phytophthora nicotianae P1569]ETL34823.1 hypothetical protein L916_12994 [Phytophthora nicotianae]ETO70008.1 hypothetical protein F444_13483 [Phytophthora nicotianae P1976]ETP39249.1 hypothetical protein F442_13280 [Phytophthora nicotianae P10297]ETL88067.1 hypothetical protein L917_12834 [Phytophthora nicotianae]
MSTDLDFLDEVVAFLASDSLPATTANGVELVKEQNSTRKSHSVPFIDIESCVDVDQDNKRDSNPYKMKSKRTTQGNDYRPKRYRDRVKNERQELKRVEKELSLKKQELIDAREGRKTTKPTDLALSTPFWQEMATRQREEREQAEMEQKRLVAAVQSQASYIENFCAIQHERPSISRAGRDAKQVDDDK